MLLTLNVTVVVTVMFPLCGVLLIGLNAWISDWGDKGFFENGGLAHLGGGGGGVVLMMWVGECCVLEIVLVVGNE